MRLGLSTFGVSEADLVERASEGFGSFLTRGEAVTPVADKLGPSLAREEMGVA